MAAAAAAAVAGIDAIVARPEYVAEIMVTEKNTIASFLRYRCMLEKMMEWWLVQYPQMYAEIAFVIPDDYDHSLSSQHYYRATQGLKFYLLDPKWVKLFLSAEKKWNDKAKGIIQYGFNHPWRYHDTVLKCAGESSYELHPKYRTAMKLHLDINIMKKEKTNTKGNSSWTRTQLALGFTRSLVSGPLILGLLSEYLFGHLLLNRGMSWVEW